MGRRDNTLEYFMWAWQPHFQISARSSAENLFQKLDPRFKPELFLLGFIRERDSQWHDVCIEPEERAEEVSHYVDVRNLAALLVERDPRSRITQSHPQAQKDQDKFVLKRSLQRAVKQTVERVPSSVGMVTFCSMPTVVDRYDVIVVLQLQADVFDSHYRLTKEHMRWDETRVARSYLDATALSFLDGCADELRCPEPGKSLLALHRRMRTVPEEAASSFAARIAFASDTPGMGGALFDTFSAISAMFYEKEAGRGRLVLAEREHPNVNAEVSLSDPVRFSAHRAVRRLVEVSSRGICLLSDGAQVYGLGSVRREYDSQREDLFEIEFAEHHQWNVLHDGHIMMRVAYNRPLPLLPRLDRNKIASDLFRIFGIGSNGSARLLEIITEATELGHGAQIVISSHAESEAARLSPQATSIEPVTLTPDLVRKFCAVDGAVLLAPDGRCHAFGVILDGVVSAKGDRSRGSRYNSAVRYSDGRNDCLVVVISDDKTIDIVPDLRPQVSRNQISCALDELDRLVAADQADEPAYNVIMSWLRERAFYLSAIQCGRVNASRKRAEGTRKSEVGRLYVVYDDLAPSEEMNESYLLD